MMRRTNEEIDAITWLQRGITPRLLEKSYYDGLIRQLSAEKNVPGPVLTMLANRWEINRNPKGGSAMRSRARSRGVRVGLHVDNAEAEG